MSLCVRMSVCPKYQASIFLAKQDTSGTQLYYCDRRFRSQKKADYCTVILLWSIHLRKTCKLSGSWFPSCFNLFMMFILFTCDLIHFSPAWFPGCSFMQRSPECRHPQLSTGRVWRAGKAETMVFKSKEKSARLFEKWLAKARLLNMQS